MKFFVYFFCFSLASCNLINTLIGNEKESGLNSTEVLLSLAVLTSNSGYQWNLPPGFPVPNVPEENPMSYEKVELGRHLFYDKRLSGNETQSCASCHIQEIAFSDAKTVGVGSTGESHPRNSQQLVNVAYHPRLTWANPSFETLEKQMRVPLFGNAPIELGLQSDDYLNKFQNDSQYVELFGKAYGGGIENINEENLRFAIASFQRTLISGNSPYDKYINGDKSAMSASAVRGMKLFNGETAECFHCHGGFNFTDTSFHSQTVFEEIFYHNNGLHSEEYYANLNDNQKGLYEITKQKSDEGKFRAPSLRNVGLTFPYMHDGSIDCSDSNKDNKEACAREALGKVLDHYMSGGQNHPNKDTTLIREFSFTPQEKEDLIEFLMNLTDEEFITNPDFSNPFE